MRGLRAIADFETELQLAHNNHHLAPEVDTVFFMTSLDHGYVSSSLVREIALFGGDVATMVPAPAAHAPASGWRTAGGGLGLSRLPACHNRPTSRRAGTPSPREAVRWTSSFSSSDSSR